MTVREKRGLHGKITCLAKLSSTLPVGMLWCMNHMCYRNCSSRAWKLRAVAILNTLFLFRAGLVHIKCEYGEKLTYQRTKNGTAIHGPICLPVNFINRLHRIIQVWGYSVIPLLGETTEIVYCSARFSFGGR